MNAIAPGDWVECVDARPAKGFAFCSLRQGRLYVATALSEHPLYGPLVHVSECRSVVGGFLLRRFRPIYRPKSSLIEHLKKPIEVEA